MVKVSIDMVKMLMRTVLARRMRCGMVEVSDGHGQEVDANVEGTPDAWRHGKGFSIVMVKMRFEPGGHAGGGAA